MPYNGSGVFSVINTFTPVTTILSSAMNANNVDFATGFTAVLPRDGQSAMTGALRLADGSQALPGLAFSGDTNTGLRRSAADVLRAVTGGVDAMMWDAAQKVWALGALDVAGVATFQAVVTLINAGLRLLDTNASHGLIIKPGSDLTADRILTLVTGDAARTLTLNGDAILPAGTGLVAANNLSDVANAATAFGNIKQTATTGASGAVQLADQAAMEAQTAGRGVTADVQQSHPGHPKFWAYATVSGGVPTLAASYNVTSITDVGLGLLLVTIATDFSSANWCCGVTVEHSTVSSVSAHVGAVDLGGQAAGSVQARCMDTGAGSNATLQDPSAWHVVGFGDQ